MNYLHYLDNLSMLEPPEGLLVDNQFLQWEELWKQLPSLPRLRLHLLPSATSSEPAVPTTSDSKAPTALLLLIWIKKMKQWNCFCIKKYCVFQCMAQDVIRQPEKYILPISFLQKSLISFIPLETQHHLSNLLLKDLHADSWIYNNFCINSLIELFC